MVVPVIENFVEEFQTAERQICCVAAAPRRGERNAADRRKTERRTRRRDAVFGDRVRPRARRRADRHGAERIGKIDAVADDRRVAARSRPERCASKARRALALGRGGLPLSRPPQRDEDGADGRGESRLLGGLSRRAAAQPCRRRWTRSGSAGSAICRSAISRPARSAARRSPGCWSATARSGCSTSRRPGSTRARRQDFAALVNEHLRAGGIVIAATHQPLGIARREGAWRWANGCECLSSFAPRLTWRCIGRNALA